MHLNALSVLFLPHCFSIAWEQCLLESHSLTVPIYVEILTFPEVFRYSFFQKFHTERRTDMSCSDGSANVVHWVCCWCLFNISSTFADGSEYFILFLHFLLILAYCWINLSLLNRLYFWIYNLIVFIYAQVTQLPLCSVIELSLNFWSKILWVDLVWV